jgi:hypothetical protein
MYAWTYGPWLNDGTASAINEGECPSASESAKKLTSLTDASRISGPSNVTVSMPHLSGNLDSGHIHRFVDLLNLLIRAEE